MFKKWMGMALLAACLGQGTRALAQYLPSSVGAARMPDPLPAKSTADVPNLVPGPISPLAAPKGPPDELSLPANINNAFPCEEFPGPRHAYFHIGAQGFQRQKPGHRLIGFTDAANTDAGLDQGDLTRFNNIVPALDQNALTTLLRFGGRATLGYLFEDYGCAIELSGFYIPRSTKSVDAINPGQLNSFFTNPPLGFEGDNGLWLQADHIRTSLSTTLSGAELNYRTFNKIMTGIEPIVGLRYINLHENFSIFTDDDGLSFPNAFGQGDPRRMATYSTRVNTNIVAPQVGLEYQHSFIHGFAFGFFGKAAAGASFNDIAIALTRGDGRAGLAGSRSKINFSQVYESGLFFDVYLLERARLRAGYTALWLVNVPLASDQVNFDLSAPLGTQSNNGSVFFHGPSLELQFLF